MQDACINYIKPTHSNFIKFFFFVLYHVPEMGQGTQNIEVNQRNSSCPHEAYILVLETEAQRM